MNRGTIKLDPLAKELLHGVTVRPISRQERTGWDKLMQQHHYLGYRAFVGESIRYVAELNGRWIALIGWASAAFQCEVRDKWIGWPPIIKNQHLRFFKVTNIARILRNFAARPFLALQLLRW